MKLYSRIVPSHSDYYSQTLVFDPDKNTNTVIKKFNNMSNSRDPKWLTKQLVKIRSKKDEESLQYATVVTAISGHASERGGLRLMNLLLAVLSDPVMANKIKDKFGNSILDACKIKNSENRKKYSLGLGEPYEGEIDVNKREVHIWTESFKDMPSVYEEAIISVELFISLLQRIIKEHEEFKKDPQAYEKKIEAGEKVFEVTENDIDLDKMIEEFKEKHKQLLDLNNNEPRLNNKPKTKKWYEFWKN